MNHNEPARSDDDLVFTALQYIGDELTDDARGAFEARLLNDQAAREAVASAVEVSLATRAAFAEDGALLVAEGLVSKSSTSIGRSQRRRRIRGFDGHTW